jgi:hypothetical protein
MHSLNLAHARAFNDRHTLRGHVQFDRYGPRRIRDEDDLLGRYAYVANNPVRACLCESAAEWLWSSYAGTVGLAPAQPFVDPRESARLFRLVCHRPPCRAAPARRGFVTQPYRYLVPVVSYEALTGKLRRSGPMYSADGRMSLLSARCSSTCAA